MPFATYSLGAATLGLSLLYVSVQTDLVLLMAALIAVLTIIAAVLWLGFGIVGRVPWRGIGVAVGIGLFGLFCIAVVLPAT